MDDKFDGLLNRLGTGKWNLIIIIASSYWMIMIPFNILGGAFLAPSIPYTCVPPDNAAAVYTTTTDNVTFSSQCVYEEEMADGTIEQRRCTDWVFDNSTYVSTLTSEFKLVCERKYLRATVTSTYLFTALVGSTVNGFLADKFGRKRMVIVGTVGYSLMGFLLSWMPNMTAILVCRLLLGLFHPSAIHSNYTLAMEVSEPRWRALVGILIFLPWSIGTLVYGGFGYFIRNWRWLQFAVSLPAIIFFPMLWFMDESPRWLIVRGQFDRALEVLQRAARWNKASLPPPDELREIMKHIHEVAQSKSVKSHKAASLQENVKRFFNSIAVLFRTPKMCTLTVAMYFIYTVLGMVFYGLSLSGDSLGGNPFLYMTLSGVMELPGSTVTIPMVERLGRRISSILCFGITGVSLLVLPFIPASVTWLVTTLALMGKMSISGAFQIAFLHASEAFPTEVRSRGLGSSSMLSQIGSAVSPFIVDFLGELQTWAPSVLFGIAGILGCLITSTLPETLGMPLYDTVAALEAAPTIKKRFGKPEDKEEINKLQLPEEEPLTPV